MLLIVKDWLKWVKMKTWSHSGRCLVCKCLKFFFGNPDINGSGSPNSQRARLPRNILDGSNVSVHMRVSSHFLSSHLATASSFTQPSSLPPPPPPSPLPYCGAFAFHVSPGDVPWTNFAWFGGRGFPYPGVTPELLTRTWFPILIYLNMEDFTRSTSTLAYLSRMRKFVEVL